MLFVLLFGAAGAYLGDLVSYAVLRAAGPPLAERVGWLRADDPDGALARIRTGIEAHELRTLLLSRLVPGGRIPVLLAASLGGYPWIRFASADIAASLLWSTAYAVIGIIGNSLLPNTTIALIVVVAAAMLLTVVMQLVQRHRRADDTQSAEQHAS
ncbi:hypothetical protein FGL98_13420 [Leekyejoonella antrihumi]|uniref:VTT domain-containing protein n=2 Tax=Leekyejoonella antrihumi TaxID=1660198 RepID=A0A563DZS4_9MICO|nr:hypothetical protein FGL98_13420 [Leekyejoonella antrihumi]